MNQLVPFRSVDASPALIAAAGERAKLRFLEFFTANIRNPNTRRAYARACAGFFAWCEPRGLTLTTIRPHDDVRLADRRPGRAVPPGLGGSRPQARCQDRQDAGGQEWRRLIDTIPATRCGISGTGR